MGDGNAGGEHAARTYLKVRSLEMLGGREWQVKRRLICMSRKASCRAVELAESLARGGPSAAGDIVVGHFE
ncbi:MAG: hypothetical protein DMG91_16540 [Acidobacteria bacterium]|nr:MAG: hypothetical protein DMG91_16540 [Acidobacteriota bacterium]